MSPRKIATMSGAYGVAKVYTYKVTGEFEVRVWHIYTDRHTDRKVLLESTADNHFTRDRTEAMTKAREAAGPDRVVHVAAA